MKKTSSHEYEKEIYQILNYLEANQKYIGFHYSIYLISLYARDVMDDSLVSAEKMTGENGFYGRTATHFQKNNWRCVERGIRKLVNQIYLETPKEKYCEVFGTKKVTNKQFIEILRNHVIFGTEFGV